MAKAHREQMQLEHRAVPDRPDQSKLRSVAQSSGANGTTECAIFAISRKFPAQPWGREVRQPLLRPVSGLSLWISPEPRLRNGSRSSRGHFRNLQEISCTTVGLKNPRYALLCHTPGRGRTGQETKRAKRQFAPESTTKRNTCHNMRCSKQKIRQQVNNNTNNRRSQ